MLTGSADHSPWPEESATRVAIGEPSLRPRPRRSGPAAELDGAQPERVRPASVPAEPHRPDPASRSLGDYELPDLDLTDFGLALDQLDDRWMAQAACTGRTNLFFGIAGERPERRIRRERTARAVCEGCAVVAPCRERARTGRENGFWGGESEEERAAAGYPPRSISRRSVQQASTVRAS